MSELWLSVCTGAKSVAKCLICISGQFGICGNGRILVETRNYGGATPSLAVTKMRTENVHPTQLLRHIQVCSQMSEKM